MKANPFIESIPSPLPAFDDAWNPPPGHARGATIEHRDPPSRRTLFPILTGLLTGTFLVLMLFVFQEIRHTRELHRMSLSVSRTEAEKRRWQEKQRVEEARNATLLAELRFEHPRSRDRGLPGAVSTDRAMAMR